MPCEYFQGTPGAAAQRLRRQLDALSDCRGPHVFDAEDVCLVLEYLEANERARLAEHEAYKPAVRTGSDRLSEAAPPVNAVAVPADFPHPIPGRGSARKPPIRPQPPAAARRAFGGQTARLPWAGGPRPPAGAATRNRNRRAATARSGADSRTAPVGRAAAACSRRRRAPTVALATLLRDQPLSTRKTSFALERGRLTGRPSAPAPGCSARPRSARRTPPADRARTATPPTASA